MLWTTKPVQSCHLLRVPQLFSWTGHQSKTKVSSEHYTYNKPKILSPDTTKEGLSLSLSLSLFLSPVNHRRLSEEQPQHYGVQETYANQD
jgi:hypothetical protein